MALESILNNLVRVLCSELNSPDISSIQNIQATPSFNNFTPNTSKEGRKKRRERGKKGKKKEKEREEEKNTRGETNGVRKESVEGRKDTRKANR